MRVLDRYLLRQLMPPLLFAFTAMTSIMLLNQVARRFGQLVGKGLPWSVIGEVFLLCLPFIIAMTLPMSVLIAMLFAYSHLAADSEITAMRASGVSVFQMLRPALLAGVLLTGVNFWFTDQILPDSNAKLRNLLINIQRKKPTLELREQVINEIPPSSRFLRAGRIDPNTGRLRDVTIYDMSESDERRVIYADSGIMGFSPDATDLSLRLFDGSIHEFKASEATTMQVTDFVVNHILIKDVSNRLDLENNDDVRGDREMSTCTMYDVVRDADHAIALSEQRRRTLIDRDLRLLLDQPRAAPPAPIPPPPVKGYCRVFRKVGAVLKSWTARTDSATQDSTAESDNVAPPTETRQKVPLPTSGTLQSPPRGVPKGVPNRPAPETRTKPKPKPSAPAAAKPVVRLPRSAPPGRLSATFGDTGRRSSLPAAQARAKPQQTITPPPVARKPPPHISQWGDVSQARDESQSSQLRVDQYRVEIHKKWAISLACLVFAIVGIPMALRFPRGGMGLVIGGGLCVFAIYYVGLIAGEGLGNKGLVSPAAAMWAPNVIFVVVGLIGLYRVNRDAGSTRGGDLADLWDSLTGKLRRRKAA